MQNWNQSSRYKTLLCIPIITTTTINNSSRPLPPPSHRVNCGPTATWSATTFARRPPSAPPQQSAAGSSAMIGLRWTRLTTSPAAPLAAGRRTSTTPTTRSTRWSGSGTTAPASTYSIRSRRRGLPTSLPRWVQLFLKCESWGTMNLVVHFYLLSRVGNRCKLFTSEQFVGGRRELLSKHGSSRSQWMALLPVYHLPGTGTGIYFLVQKVRWLNPQFSTPGI